MYLNKISNYKNKNKENLFIVIKIIKNTKFYYIKKCFKLFQLSKLMEQA